METLEKEYFQNFSTFIAFMKVSPYLEDKAGVPVRAEFTKILQANFEWFNYFYTTSIREISLEGYVKFISELKKK